MKNKTKGIALTSLFLLILFTLTCISDGIINAILIWLLIGLILTILCLGVYYIGKNEYIKASDRLLLDLFGDNIPSSLDNVNVSQSIKTNVEKGMSLDKSINHVTKVLRSIYHK